MQGEKGNKQKPVESVQWTGGKDREKNKRKNAGDAKQLGLESEESTTFPSSNNDSNYET